MQWLGEQKSRFKHVIAIAGNHDFLFQDEPSLARMIAKEKGVIAIVDCGVAPGCSNLLVGFMETQ
jgi:saccharopine dehydrogenase-like NADP-dependent oxidoreductase